MPDCGFEQLGHSITYLVRWWVLSGRAVLALAIIARKNVWRSDPAREELEIVWWGFCGLHLTVRPFRLVL